MDDADKAGMEFWEGRWKEARNQRTFRPNGTGVVEHIERAWHAEFVSSLGSTLTDSSKILMEVGCGASQNLPYFRKAFDCEVRGIDYAPSGVASAKAALQAAGVDGEIKLGDMYADAHEWHRSADVVASFGLVEHFEDTAAAVRAVSRFVKPGGLVVTSVPNMAGATGVLQKYINRPVYDVHVPLNLEQLRAAHAQAGLRVIRHRYLGNFSPYTVEWVPENASMRFAWRMIRSAINRSMGTLDLVLGEALPKPDFLAPYAYCVAQYVEE